MLKPIVMSRLVLWLGTLLFLLPNAASNPLESHRHAGQAQTIKHIMDTMVNPNAQALWDSVASYASLDHVEEKSPQRDADWEKLRKKASRLLMAAHLLAVPDRPVAEPGDQSKNPSIELSPGQIEALISNDRPAWTSLVQGLEHSSVLILNAIDEKNLAGLRSANDALNGACERCHQKYWYPNRERLLQR